MDAMESKMAEWRRHMPSKRALTTQLGKYVQQKSVQVLYTQSEQDRIKTVTELITKATNEFEKEEHWDRIMKVVDALANTSNRAVLKESIRFLRLRLGDPDPSVVLLALTLAEALVKNCGAYVHKEIGGEAFMSEMESVHRVYSQKRGYEAMKIESRVLELVQAWGEAFMPRKFEYPYFIYTYERLRKKGARFPKYDKSKAPVFTPPRSVRSSSSASNSEPGSKSHLAKLSSKEVFHVARNVDDMFGDMLHEAEKDDSAIGEHGVIVELAVQAQELVERLQTVIQEVADTESEEELSRYLAINDSLHTALIRYDELKAKKVKSNQATNDDDDDEFGDFVRARVRGESDVKSTDNQKEEADDDPFASFVSQRVTKTTTKEPEPKEPKAVNDLIDLWGDAMSLIDTTAAAAPAAVATASLQPAQQPDLWASDPFDRLAAPHSDAVATPTPAPVFPPKPSEASPFDLWGDAQIQPNPLPPVASSAPVMPATRPVASTSNPFDFFDDLTAKSTAPVTKAPTPSSAASMATIDPFADLAKPAPAPFATTTQHPSSANPFDF